MNVEWRQKWLTALRGGEYEQGREVLRTSTNKFCCLGVLCDLVQTSAWERNGSAAFSYDGQYHMPSYEVLYSAELSYDEVKYLANMNDHGRTFAQIADYIETNL